MRDVPVLLLEVNSDSGGLDKIRMKLQGACVVRLANSILAPKSRTFTLRAIYINADLIATEYTMYQTEDDQWKVSVPLIAK